MNISNWPKLVGVLTAMLIVGALLALGKLSEASSMTLLGLLVGYIVGNGVAARKGDSAGPIIGPRNDP